MSKFEDILRAFGKGIGRAKSAGKDFKEIMRTKVQGGCIVTAEHDLDSQQSSALRYVSVPLKSESIDTDVLTKFHDDKTYARIEGRLTTVQEIFASWISYLESHYGEIVNFLLTFQPPPLTLKFKRYRQIYRVIVDLMLRNQSAATVAETWQQFLVTLQQAIATGTALIAVGKDEFEQNGGKFVICFWIRDVNSCQIR